VASIQDCLSQIVDCVHEGIVEDLGFRPDEVAIRTRTWSGSAPGDGTYTDVDEVLVPRPRVERPDPALTANQYGQYPDGMQQVSGVSRTYSNAQLGDPGGRPANVEVFWVINGTDEYSLVQIDGKLATTTVTLRRRRGR